MVEERRRKFSLAEEDLDARISTSGWCNSTLHACSDPLLSPHPSPDPKPQPVLSQHCFPFGQASRCAIERRCFDTGLGLSCIYKTYVLSL